MLNIVETDVLIVGAGPAGSMAALLLARFGVKHIMINKYAKTSPGARSHITNQRTMEIMRDLGLEDAAKALSTPQHLMGEHVYATSLVGEELGRIRAWSTHPLSQAEHDLASPCALCDLPQLYFEPLLVNAASQAGSQVRFNTEYLDHEQDANGVHVRVRDRLTAAEYTIRAKYLIGADGARSKVAQDIGLTYDGDMALGGVGSLNIEFSADLSSLVSHRPGDMYWIVQPGTGIRGNGIGSLRMVRPWHKWIAVWGYDLADGPPSMTPEQAIHVVQRLIGTDQIPITIDAMSTWTINRQFALSNTKGRVFCMGDAVHRHPPLAGLGLNTSMQDAYNLCWKLAWVLQGKAGARLLESYDAERSPIARQIVEYAYGCGIYFFRMFESLGLGRSPSAEAMAAGLQSLKDPGADGVARRAGFRKAMDDTLAGFGGGHGVEMNQHYVSGAIAPDGSSEPHFSRDPRHHYQPSTRPGAHLPHAWLTQNQHRISTLDLCGKGQFTLLTGLAGKAIWTAVVHDIARTLNLEITVHAIGPGEDVLDTYGDFAKLAKVSEHGALLVRPDMFVAWRAADGSAEHQAGLQAALKSILSRS